MSGCGVMLLGIGGNDTVPISYWGGVSEEGICCITESRRDCRL